MTQADSSDSGALASLPTVLHGSTGDNDEPSSDEREPASPPQESRAPTPSSPSTDRRPTHSPTGPRDQGPSPEPPASSTSPSSTTSTSEPEAVGIAAGVGAVAGDVVDAAALPAVLALGLAANRLYQRRTGDRSQRWLFTEEESQALAGAVGRITARRLPEQLVEGEGGDVLLIVGVTGGYLVRNALGVTEAQMRAAAGEPAPGQPPAPVPDHPVTPPRHARADQGGDEGDDEEPDEVRGAHIRVLSAADVGAV